MVAFHHSHTLQLVPSLLLGLVLSTLLALPLRALAHLRCYYAAVGAPTGSKKVKARRGAKKDDDIDLGGAEALVMAPLSIQQAAQLSYRGAFENLVRQLRLVCDLPASAVHCLPTSKSTGSLRLLASPALPSPAPAPVQFIASLFAVSSSATGMVAERLLGWPASGWPALLALSTSFVALAMLAKVGCRSLVASSPPCWKSC